MGKFKKKILINKKEYSTNEARKFLADNLKKDNVAKCDIPKLITYLSKREAFKYYCVVGGEIYIIDIVLFNKEDRNRTNKHGENIYLKRNNIKNKIEEYNSIVNEIFNNENIRNKMKKSLVEKIEKATETEELFDCKAGFFNENGEFIIEYRNYDYRFEFFTKDLDIYLASSNLRYNSLKDVERQLENLKKIKENLEI